MKQFFSKLFSQPVASQSSVEFMGVMLKVAVALAVFFVIVGIFSVLRFEKIGAINFYLTLPLLFFILYLL